MSGSAIRRYQPVQFIDVSRISPGIVYKEFRPSLPLDQYVSCYWTVRSKYPLPGVTHRIIPDGCMDIICNFHERKAFITCMSDTTEFFPISGSVHYMGIRFLPRAVPYILRGNASGTLNTTLEFEDLPGELGELSSRILEANDEDAAVRIIPPYLESFFASYSIHRKFGTLLEHALVAGGAITVSGLASCHAISEKQVGRYFTENLGISTKPFLRIVRFQNALKCFRSCPHTNIDQALDSGFYDQSHLIREIRHFLGGVQDIY